MNRKKCCRDEWRMWAKVEEEDTGLSLVWNGMGHLVGLNRKWNHWLSEISIIFWVNNRRGLDETAQVPVFHKTVLVTIPTFFPWLYFCHRNLKAFFFSLKTLFHLTFQLSTSLFPYWTFHFISKAATSPEEKLIS